MNITIMQGFKRILIVISLCSFFMAAYSQNQIQSNEVRDKMVQIFTESYLITTYGKNNTFNEYYLNILRFEEHFTSQDTITKASKFICYTFFIKRSSYYISCIIDTLSNDFFIAKEGFSNSEKITASNYKNFINKNKNVLLGFDLINALFIPNGYALVDEKNDTLSKNINKPYYLIYNDLFDINLYLRFRNTLQVYSNTEKKWIDYFNYKFPILDRQLGPDFIR